MVIMAVVSKAGCGPLWQWSLRQAVVIMAVVSKAGCGHYGSGL